MDLSWARGVAESPILVGQLGQRPPVALAYVLGVAVQLLFHLRHDALPWTAVPLLSQLVGNLQPGAEILTSDPHPLLK